MPRRGVVPGGKKEELKMKNVLIVAAVVVLVIAMGSGAFAAPGSVTVSVNGSVASKCVSNSNGQLQITIDPSATGNQYMTATQPSVQCTNGKTVAISAACAGGTDNGAGTLTGCAMAKSGFNSIPYTFTYSASVSGNGFGSASAIATNIGGYVAQNDAQVAQYASGYQDTVTLTINY